MSVIKMASPLISRKKLTDTKDDLNMGRQTAVKMQLLEVPHQGHVRRGSGTIPFRKFLAVKLSGEFGAV